MSEGSISKFRQTAIKLLGSLADGTKRPQTPTLFQARQEVLTPQEQAAYRALVDAGADSIVVFPKFHLVDFLSVRDGVEQISDAVRMDRKRVDFLLCDAKSMRPLAVVELFSNQRKGKRRPYQDPFIARALNLSGLSSFRIEARDSYPIDELRERLMDRLVQESEAHESAATAEASDEYASEPSVADGPAEKNENK